MPNPLPCLNACKIAVVGLGYVGLPLAVEFGKRKLCSGSDQLLNRSTIGFDIDPVRISQLLDGFDRTKEISSDELASAHHLTLTADPNSLNDADIFIVSVPTPIDSAKRPDLTLLKRATQTVGSALRNRFKDSSAVVIFESTVYPGVTEEICVPILETSSGLIFNQDFFCGYSPERINPGDNHHKLTSIIKVTSGSTPEAAKLVDELYASIITAGTHLAPSIKVAEAAKVIENTQRDLNIALINELAIIFRHMQIDTNDVLEAAGTKWNFMHFRPGLVGGHCIGVDPYYLTYKAEQLGYYPQLVLAGRRVNDSMGSWIVNQLILEMVRRQSNLSQSKVLILGITFKENCPDLRNTKAIDLVLALQSYGIQSHIVDPWVDTKEAATQYGIAVQSYLPQGEKYDAIIVAVAHNEFRAIHPKDWNYLLSDTGLIVDLQNIVPRSLSPLRL